MLDGLAQRSPNPPPPLPQHDQLLVRFAHATSPRGIAGILTEARARPSASQYPQSQSFFGTGRKVEHDRDLRRRNTRNLSHPTTCHPHPLTRSRTIQMKKQRSQYTRYDDLHLHPLNRTGRLILSRRFLSRSCSMRPMESILDQGIRTGSPCLHRRHHRRR